MTKHVKKYISILLVCAFCTLMLTGCGGGGSNGSPQAQKDAVLSLLNSVRVSNGLNSLVENEQADIVAARMANSGLDYYRGNITIDQFKAEYYDAGLTTVQARYCTAIYADTCIPTRTSDFSGQNVSYKNGNLVGIAIRQYRNMVTTVIIVY